MKTKVGLYWLSFFQFDIALSVCRVHRPSKNDLFVSTRSGMLEAGVDRIISQVVDPKLNHIFRPQIERAIHEFLAAKKKEAVPAPPPEPESQDPPAPSQDAS